jgi:hypothetical protein
METRTEAGKKTQPPPDSENLKMFSPTLPSPKGKGGFQSRDNSKAPILSDTDLGYGQALSAAPSPAHSVAQHASARIARTQNAHTRRPPRVGPLRVNRLQHLPAKHWSANSHITSCGGGRPPLLPRKLMLTLTHSVAGPCQQLASSSIVPLTARHLHAPPASTARQSLADAKPLAHRNRPPPACQRLPAARQQHVPARPLTAPPPANRCIPGPIQSIGSQQNAGSVNMCNGCVNCHFLMVVTWLRP